MAPSSTPAFTDFTFHDLRHCFGSHLGMAGTNQKAMMELMGHKDPKMTLRYTHLSVENKRQAVRTSHSSIFKKQSPAKFPHPEKKEKL
jgi:site-specific recombinase XerD